MSDGARPPSVAPPEPTPTARERGQTWSVYRAPDGTIERDLKPPRLMEALKEDGTLWVDIDSTDRAQHALLEKVFGFHHLAIEDTLSPQTRVKAEEYANTLFVVMRSVRFNDSTPDPYDIETFNVYLFLSANCLVTVHSARAKAIEEMQDRVARSADTMARGSEMLAHGVMDTVVDEFLPMVDRVDAMVDEIEERLFGAFDETAIKEIFQIKRLVVQLRRYLAPLREVLNVITNRPHACIKPAAQIYFRDVHDHTMRVVESVDSTRDLLSTVLDTYLSQASNRMNLVMKSLSVVATISLPLVALAGIFGMNFTQMPLIHSPLGFFVALALMAVLGLAMYVFLRTRKWI